MASEETTQHIESMTEGAPSRAILKFAIPLILGYILQQMYLISHPLKTIFQHKACTDKLYADSFYKVQKNSHSSFEVICCRS